MRFSTEDASARGAADVVEVETPHAALRYPGTFEPMRVDAADLVLVTRDDPPGFRPNLVLTSVLSTAPLPDAAMSALLAAPAQHPAARVLSCDLWDLADVEGGDDTALGRRIVFLYRGDDTRDVLVHKWVWATGQHHVHLSASCLPSQAEALVPAFTWIARSLRLSAPDAAVRAAAVATGAAPVDAEASLGVGVPLEDLGSFPLLSWLCPGSAVTLDALQALLDGASRSRIGASAGILPKALRDTAEAAELVSAGWLDERGKLSTPGSDAATALADGTAWVIAKVRRGSRAALLRAYPHRRGVLVVRDAHPDESPLDSDRLRIVSHASNDQLPGLVAAWIGLGPAWSFTPDADDIDPRDLESHLAHDPGVEPWDEFLVRTPLGEWYGVRSPSRGFLSIGAPAEGRHPVTPLPSGALADALLRLASG
ncbi:hypothetical protein AB1K54_05185 [Microbacterium sp. BWT-B31]|uniref:hypothetical protein n=1 Tax=Microbacterium sp. BWT-B31 TaxID=3232072 RepID=UPI0035283EA7